MRTNRVTQYNRHNYKLAYEAWLSEGTVARATAKLKRDGVINSYGKYYSRDGMRRAAKCYMVDNYAESKQMLMDNYHRLGYDVSDEDIERYMIKTAITILRTRDNVTEWLKNNGLYGKHVKFIESMMTIEYD